MPRPPVLEFSFVLNPFGDYEISCECGEQRIIHTKVLAVAWIRAHAYDHHVLIHVSNLQGQV